MKLKPFDASIKKTLTLKKRNLLDHPLFHKLYPKITDRHFCEEFHKGGLM